MIFPDVCNSIKNPLRFSVYSCMYTVRTLKDDFSIRSFFFNSGNWQLRNFFFGEKSEADGKNSGNQKKIARERESFFFFLYHFHPSDIKRWKNYAQYRVLIDFHLYGKVMIYEFWFITLLLFNVLFRHKFKFTRISYSFCPHSLFSLF